MSNLKNCILSLIVIISYSTSNAQTLLPSTVNEKKSEKKLVNKPVARVNNQYITIRDVQINFYLDKANYNEKGINNVSLFYDPKNIKNFINETTAYLLEWVVYLEAEDINTSQVNKNEIDKAIKNVINGLKKNKYWNDLQVSKKEIESFMQRKLRAKKFIQFKVESSVINVSDTEAKAYYEKNRIKFGNHSYEAFSSQIKNFLTRQQIDRNLKDWFDILRNKYRVRNLLLE